MMVMERYITAEKISHSIKNPPNYKLGGFSFNRLMIFDFRLKSQIYYLTSISKAAPQNICGISVKIMKLF